MNKLYAIIAILAIVLIGGICWGVHKYIQTAIENGLASCHFAGEMQNKTIKQSAIDKQTIKDFNANLPELKKEIAAKYKSQEPQSNKTQEPQSKCQRCENKIKDIINALHIFYTSNHSRP